MRTIKRSVPNIDTIMENKTKYFNQMKWDGIIQEDNIYDISQYSVRDAKNVYVDDSNHLVSRLPLSNEEIGQHALPNNHTLKDILTFGDIKVYVSQYINNSNTLYNINLNNSSTANMTINNIENYHIDKVDHYIICFNDKGAKVFDINDTTSGWQNFSDFVEIPIVKRTTGSVTTRYKGNEFTESYKEQYVWAGEERAILPEGNSDVEIQTEQGEVEFSLVDTQTFTDDRILRPLNIELEEGDVFTVSKNNEVMCISRNNYFLVSYNNGNSWKKIDYPQEVVSVTHSVLVASVSDDGLCFFFATNLNNRGFVYRCKLDDFTWVYFECYETTELSPPYSYNVGTYINESGYDTRTIKGNFVNAEVFAFCNFSSGKLYYKVPNSTKVCLADVSNYLPKKSNNQLIPPYDPTDNYGRELGWMSIICDVTDDLILTVSFGLIPNFLQAINVGNTVNLVCFESSLGTDNLFYSFGALAYSVNYPISPVSVSFRQISDVVVVAKKLFYSNNNFRWMEEEIKFDFQLRTATQQSVKTIAPYGEFFFPHTLADGNYLQNFDIVQRIGIDNYNIEKLPDTMTLAKDTEIILYDNESDPIVNNKKETIMTDDYYYVIIGNKILTNYMLEKNIVTFTYNYISENEFIRVPNVSYSGIELYLGFDNLLQITENTRDEEDATKILFNLPSVNNQSFISSINGMTNISTTEVALFFNDEIIICSKVKDENRESGYVYNYNNTKLSMGIRPGDTVMNTLEGSLTVFPTRRGLALMNYQAFMATTDQVITYISDNIKDIWTEFYDEVGSTSIKIIQWRNYLVITNGKNDILLYNLVSNTWWRWEVPINIEKAITDQIDLSVVSQLLYRFKEMNVYYDFANTYNEVEIDWFIRSQPLFMNAPTYYKNLRQLVFQFYDSEDADKKRTLNTKIVLYRKKVTDREPETILFKVDEYRTFVKRFNYWKINEVQWELSNDKNNSLPRQLKLNGISVKYELGYEVR